VSAGFNARHIGNYFLHYELVRRSDPAPSSKHDWLANFACKPGQSPLRQGWTMLDWCCLVNGGNASIQCLMRSDDTSMACIIDLHRFLHIRKMDCKILMNFNYISQTLLDSKLDSCPGDYDE